MTSTPSTARTASTMDLPWSAEAALTVRSRMMWSRPTLTMSMAPMSPPACPMAVVSPPSIPARLEIFTRKVRL
jgi:hypothetical protein